VSPAQRGREPQRQFQEPRLEFVDLALQRFVALRLRHFGHQRQQAHHHRRATRP
jgi:hypothetical protein